MTVFKCDRAFRATLADALLERDRKTLENMRQFADKQVASLTPRGEHVGPLVAWPALLESWRADLETLKQALEHTCESR